MIYITINIFLQIYNYTRNIPKWCWQCPRMMLLNIPGIFLAHLNVGHRNILGMIEGDWIMMWEYSWNIPISQKGWYRNIPRTFLCSMGVQETNIAQKTISEISVLFVMYWVLIMYVLLYWVLIMFKLLYWVLIMYVFLYYNVL